MERRSWLWRRKSSASADKILPADFSDGSVGSAVSERFFDDHHQATYSSTPTPSHLSAAPRSPFDEQFDSDGDDDLKTLKGKLSAALLSLKAKDDLVTQHAKVAEEAVSGWEKAEKEVVALKHQLENVNKKNGGLEDRVGHLDAALKECMRQLRVSREEQQHLATKIREFESTNSELVAKSETPAAASSVDPEFPAKIEGFLEKENSSLKLMLLSREEELEILIMERDLSSRAAETASKQHLEGVKKIARLEAECRKLKAMARKTGGLSMLELEPSCSPASSASPDQCMNGKDVAAGRTLIMVPSSEINLMDDFLEMERLAAVSCQSNSSTERPSKAEHEVMINRSAELEENFEKIEDGKVESELDLNGCHSQLGMLQSQLKETNAQLSLLQAELARANESIRAREEELMDVRGKKKMADEEIAILLVKVDSLEAEVQKQSASAVENAKKCVELEKKLWEMKHESEVRRQDELMRVSIFNEELRSNQERQLGVAAEKYAECQKTISSLGRQLKYLATMEEDLLVS